MMGVLPLLFALLIAHNARSHSSNGLSLFDLSTQTTAMLVMTLCIAGWWLVHRLASAALLRLAWSTERSAGLFDHISTVASLLLFAAWCRYLGWAHVSAWSIVHIIPFAALTIIGWYAAARVGCRGQRRRAWHTTVNRTRFAILPIIVAISLFDVLQFCLLEPALSALDQEASFMATAATGLAVLAMPVIVLSVLPPIVVRLWRARPMPAGPNRDLLASACAQAGVRVQQFWHWPSAGGRLYNAAVMGFVPRSRYVLFSDDLLRDLPPDQLVAVLGHELGHIRYWHMPLYLAYLIIGSMWVMIAHPPLADVVSTVLIDDDQIAHGLALIIWFVLVLRVGFGFLSRACERQADLAGAELAGGPQVMQAALANVASLAGQDPDAPSWRHYSISQRIAYLSRVDNEPQQAQQHHGQVRLISWAILVILLLVPLMVFSLARSGGPDERWLDEHPVAAAAIDQALAGDPDMLHEWLNIASIEERRNAAWLALKSSTDGTDLKKLYRQRHVLLAFVGLDLGDPPLRAMLTNNASYAVLIGATQPDPDELARIWDALPLLRKAAYTDRSPIFHDTVGCVYFAQQRRDLAQAHFEAALTLVESGSWNRRLNDVDQFIELLERRIAACKSPDAPLPLETDIMEPPAGERMDVESGDAESTAMTAFSGQVRTQGPDTRRQLGSAS